MGTASQDQQDGGFGDEKYTRSAGFVDGQRADEPLHSHWSPLYTSLCLILG